MTIPLDIHEKFWFARDAEEALAPDEYDALKGDALDKAAADADIEGRSTMTADEKRTALRWDRGLTEAERIANED